MNNKSIEKTMELLKGYKFFITGTAVLNELNQKIAAKDIDVQVSQYDYKMICEMINSIPEASVVDGTEKSKSHTEFKIGDDLWIDIISDKNFDYKNNDMDVLRIAIDENGQFQGLNAKLHEQIMDREIKHMLRGDDAFMDLGRIAKYIDKGFKIDDDLIERNTRRFVRALNTEGFDALVYNKSSILKSEVTMKVITAYTNGVVNSNGMQSNNRYDGISGGIKTIKAHAETFGKLITT